MPGFFLLGSLSCSSPLIWQGAHWISEQPIRMLMLPDPLLQNPVCRSTPSPTEALKADIRPQPWKRVRFGYPPLIVAALSGWVLLVRDLWSIKTQAPWSSPGTPPLCLCWCLPWYCLLILWSHPSALVPFEDAAFMDRTGKTNTNKPCW